METDREEPFYVYVERRERELTHQIAALRGQIEAKETELAQIRAARKITDNLGGNDRARMGAPGKPVTRLASITAENPSGISIKDLAMRALRERFFLSGATPAQLREYFRDAYGRTVERASLSPQLSRLKAEGRVTHDPETDSWRITVTGVLAKDS